jgi:ribosomal protein S18 acetylase RimI-like enzyme
MDLRWLSYGGLADAELVERPGGSGGPQRDPNLADIAVNTLRQVGQSLGQQGVELRFTIEQRSTRQDPLGRAVAAGAGFDVTTDLIQHRARLDPEVQPPTLPDRLTVRQIVDGDDRAPLERIHAAGLAGTFLRSTDTSEGTLARLAANHQSPFAVHVVEDPELPGQHVAMVATALFRSTPASPSVGEISLLAVDPDFRKRGLGRLLVQHAEAALVAGGALTAMAYIEEGNEPATELFASRGFNARATRTYFSN